MISVLLFGSHAASGRDPTTEDAVRSLAALVPAAVDGVVRDVQLIADRAEQDDTRSLARVAEHAGCIFVAGPFAEVIPRAVAAARSPVLLLLLAGVSFDRALIDEMGAWAAQSRGPIASGVALKAVETGLLGRVSPRFAPTVGLLIERDHLAAPQPSSFETFWFRQRGRHTFSNRAWTAKA